MVDILLNLWNYSKVALVHSTDKYGLDISENFVFAAAWYKLEIVLKRSFSIGSWEIMREIRESGVRVIALTCQASDGSTFLRTAMQYDVGGADYLWLGTETFADDGMWAGDEEMLAGALPFILCACIESGEAHSTLHRRQCTQTYSNANSIPTLTPTATPIPMAMPIPKPLPPMSMPMPLPTPTHTPTLTLTPTPVPILSAYAQAHTNALAHASHTHRTWLPPLHRHRSCLCPPSQTPHMSMPPPTDTALRERVLRGVFVLSLGQRTDIEFHDYLARRRQLPPTTGS